VRRGLAGECVEAHPIVENRLPEKSVFNVRAHRSADGSVAGVIVALRPAPVALLGHALPMTDPLTGLAERRDFARHLQETLAESDGERRSVAVFAINLDNLRTITNLHGAAAAAEVLKVTAGRLGSGTRSAANDDVGLGRRGDLVARLGPDQFGIVSSRSGLSLTEAEALAARFLRIVQNPIATGSESLRLNASAAFIMTGEPHRDADDVFRDLDLALQEAQTVGPNRVVGWEPALTAMASKRYSLADQLRRAFDNGEFALHYHPVMRMADDRMVGVEALLRWNHPSEGLVAPGAFLPVLEDSGLILEVGCWIVREAVRQVESWQMLYGRDLVNWIALNLSARQFIDPKPLLNTLRGIHDGGFSVGRLKFEIAETALTRNPEISRAALAELERLGIRVAIDDFGTGHSSLTSLRNYRVDTIKIDSAFIGQIGTPQGEKLVDALIDIAHGYGASVIAEGIETAPQRDFLRRGGCELGQGYLFAEPMDGARLGAYALVHATTAGDAARGAQVRPALSSAFT
jgi:diguanylate cyclase (GGDEF)-like protein